MARRHGPSCFFGPRFRDPFSRLDEVRNERCRHKSHAAERANLDAKDCWRRHGWRASRVKISGPSLQDKKTREMSSELFQKDASKIFLCRDITLCHPAGAAGESNNGQIRSRGRWGQPGTAFLTPVLRTPCYVSDFYPDFQPCQTDYLALDSSLHEQHGTVPGGATGRQDRESISARSVDAQPGPA